MLFDLDGTLVDSAPDLARAVDGVLGELGYPAAGEAMVRDWVGEGARRLLSRAITRTERYEPPAETLDHALARFFELYGQQLYRDSRPYPGVIPTLRKLAADGYRLAVVTNKPRRFAQPILEAMGVADAVPVVVGGECTPVRKPDPAPLRLALERLGATPEEALMVGDSAIDVAAARNLGIPVVCVPYGYSRGVDPADLGADAVLSGFGELAVLLRGMGRGVGEAP